MEPGARAAVRLTLLLLFGAYGCGPSTDQHQPVTASTTDIQLLATERDGVHHGEFRVRAVDVTGRPISGATLAIYDRGIGWGGRDRLAGTDTTDEDGVASVSDIRTLDSSPRVIVWPPDHLQVNPSRLLHHSTIVRGVSSGRVDLGTVVLRPMYQVVIRLPDEPSNAASLTPRLMLTNSSGARVHSRILGHSAVFERLSLGNWVLEGLDSVINTAPAGGSYPVEIESPTTWLDVRDVEEGGVPVRSKPFEIASPTYQRSGRIRYDDGSPATDLTVHAHGPNPESTCKTDSGGRFHVESSRPIPLLGVSGSGGTFTILFDLEKMKIFKDRAHYVIRPDEEVDLTLTERGRATVSLTGIDLTGVPSDASLFAYLTQTGATVPVQPSQAGRLDTTFERPLMLATPPGRIPRPFQLWRDTESLSIDFTNDAPFQLQVRDRDGSIPRAIVDIVDPETSQTLLSAKTDTKGRVKLLGPKESRYLLYVYAKGREPARVGWKSERPTVIELVPRDIPLRVSDLIPGERLVVKHAGDDRAITDIRVSTSSVTVMVTSGKYDLLATGIDDESARGRQTSVSSDQRTVQMDVDERPRVLLRYDRDAHSDLLKERAEEMAALGLSDSVKDADEEFFASATRNTPGQPSFGGAVMSVRGQDGSSRSGDTVSAYEGALIKTESGQAELVLPGTGRWRIGVETGTGYSLVKQCLIQPGEERILSVPTGNATAHGITSDFSTFDIHHGSAGPRMLFRRIGDGFDVVVYQPEREHYDEPAFTIPQIPAGPYYLHHHLSHAGGERPGEWGRCSGWGGRLIELQAGADLDLGDLKEPAPSALDITVLDELGDPLDSATLSVVDPLWEAWNEFTKIPTTGVFASDPLPDPPAARLQGEPVTLTDIRPGQLAFRIETDEGAVHDIICIVDPGEPLTIRLR